MNGRNDLMPILMGALMLLSSCGTAFGQGPKYKQVPVPVRVQPLQLSKPFTIVYRVQAQSYNEGAMSHRRFRTTLSYDGTSLLYRSEDLDANYVRTILYDGQETYELDSNSRIAEIQAGFDFTRMSLCPLPGVGIPKMPLFISGFAPSVLPTVVSKITPIQKSEPTVIDKSLLGTPLLDRDYGNFKYSDIAADAVPVVGYASLTLPKDLQV